jgi:ribonuclease HI
MELQAAIGALKAIRVYPRATIVTDSRYVIDGLTKWLANWRRRNWMTTSNTPVKNRHLWMTLERLNHAGIRWRYVRGHAGDPNNERVDCLARAFARGDTPELFCGKAGSLSDPVALWSSQGARHPQHTIPQDRKTSRDKARYISIVQGTVALDDDWESCAARVRGVSGARYKKVRSPEEVAAFCAAHGVDPPQEI